jgi:hypothetical protein
VTLTCNKHEHLGANPAEHVEFNQERFQELLIRYVVVGVKDLDYV